MAVTFMDGFDHYDTAHITGKWTSIFATPVISAAAGRISGGCLLAPNNSNSSQSVGRTVTAQATWGIGFAFKYTPVTGAAGTLVSLFDGATSQCDLRLNADGTLSVTRAGTAVTGGTSVVALSLGTWTSIQWKVTIADSIGANSCQVYVNGVLALTVATGQDLKTTANASANQLRIGLVGSLPGSTTFFFDDLWVNNDGALLGDLRVEALYPTGAGSTTAWTASAGSNWQCVDENPPTDDTDYVSTTVPGPVDTYQMGNLSSTPSTISAVQVSVLARKIDAGTRTLQPVVHSGGVDYLGDLASLGTSYAYASTVWEQNPAGPAAWTPTTVNALEAGQKEIA